VAGKKVIELIGITKRFGDLVANDSINFEIRAGEIHAVLGENGAGKSTLMKILFGTYEPDDGEMRVHGNPVRLRSPADAIRLGIGMVHQELMLVPELTAFENIILGAEPTRGRVFISRKLAWAKILELAERYRLTVDFKARIRDLSVGERQRVEILKELYRDASILIFDEPTSSIGPAEKVELLRIVRSLADSGQAVVPFITHKLSEVFEICDRITVLRHGKVAGTFERDEVSMGQLTQAMFGRDVLPMVKRTPRNHGTTVLRIVNVSLHRRDGRKLLDNVSFEVNEGEILGIAGVSGNGQLELGNSVIGLRQVTEGQIWFGAEDVTNMSAGQRLAMGYAHIFEDRALNVLGEFSVRDNVALSLYARRDFGRRWFLDYDKVQELSRQIVADYNVKCAGLESPVAQLSGGNQQKLVLGRILATHPRLVWAHNPTKGLDVASCHFIYDSLMAQRDVGTAVVLVSEELDELLVQCDRIAVMYDGRIQAIHRAEEVTREDLGRLMVRDDTNPAPIMAGTSPLIGSPA